jgi:osmotically-inducible protein OsmY
MSLLVDAARTLKIKAAIIADERLDATSINVDHVDGVTVLRGRVPTAAVRELAEGIAVRNGARDVWNELQVEDPSHQAPATIIPAHFPGVSTPAGAPPSERAACEELLRAALSADRRINEHLIQVHLENGTAYLSGRQDTVEAHDAVIEIAAHVPGVTAVVDDLEVRPFV